MAGPRHKQSGGLASRYILGSRIWERICLLVPVDPFRLICIIFMARFLPQAGLQALCLCFVRASEMLIATYMPSVTFAEAESCVSMPVFAKCAQGSATGLEHH